MARHMLIDATHPEETRVVVLSGNRLEEFDFESSTKRQVKGNIYLAKVTRVEPSLQAAFVDYGGNRHGFLAFDEIHPDYYRIPVDDRRGERAPPRANGETAGDGVDEGNGLDEGEETLAAALPEIGRVPAGDESDDHEPEGEEPEYEAAADEAQEVQAAGREAAADMEPPVSFDQRAGPRFDGVADEAELGTAPADEGGHAVALAASDEVVGFSETTPFSHGEEGAADADGEAIETIGGEEIEEIEEAEAEERPRSRPARHYKIQEVIKRRQIMLVQVVKEERGNKGAALTTYLSLAGRYCVLMPNTGRGGGVSRKITSITDRRRLKDILEDLEIPAGMGVIVRTAGAERSKAEIKRDYEYLLRLWTEIRELTLQSSAPALIYEEGNLIKRSIRDLYTRDIDEVQVEGDEGYRTAKGFMRMLMPSHAKRVQPYRDPKVSLFHRFQVESQIDAIHSPVAQLRSGGYIVINQTEALVAIDVNSGRATRERNIEETALRTNLEAAEEIARQLRLRDLAGLIVIDFIDMEEHRNHGAVERRLKDALKNDRARIQVGRITPFGLLEMSRQRLRPSLAEASTQPCPHCGGTGLIRSTESTALYVLRSIEEEGIRQRAAELCVYVPTTVALYLLNQKRASLSRIEERYGVRVAVDRDDSLIPPSFRLERLRSLAPGEAPPPRSVHIQTPTGDIKDEDDEGITEVESEDEEGENRPPRHREPRAGAESRAAHADDERGRRRRRRRRRPRSEEAGERRPAAAAQAVAVDATMIAEEAAEVGGEPQETREADAEPRRRRRGRRGGRWRGRREETAEAETGEAASETVGEAPEGGEPMPGPGAAASEPSIVEPELVEPAEEVPVEHYAVAEEPVAVAEEPPPPAAALPATEPEAAAEPQLVPGPEPALAVPAAPHREIPAADVHAVEERPANPRRGWWQRLIVP